MRRFLIITLILILIPLSLTAGTLNVMDFGAKADGKTDDTTAFNAALTKASQTPGSTVLAPSGTYLIAGTVTIPFNTTLQGEYHGPGRQQGTTLLATGNKGKSDGSAGCISTSGYSTIRNIAIEYPEQTADVSEPVPYPWAIALAGNSRAEDIYLHNPYLGIIADESPGTVIRNVWGEPLRIGMRIDHILDVCRIENIHFWPYFTEGKPMRQWVQQNGVAFEFGRVDWAYCSNTFCYGYMTGYRFYLSSGVSPNRPAGVTNGNFLGIGADSARFAIDVEDSNNIGISITNGEFVASAGKGCRGIVMRKSNTGNLTLANCNFWAMQDCVAEVQSGCLNLNGCNISDWGGSFWKTNQPSVPAFLVSGGRLNVNGCTFNRGGMLAALSGDDTRALFNGNIGTEPLEIVSWIKDRAVIGINNPSVEVNQVDNTPAQPTSEKPAKPAAKEPAKPAETTQEMPDH